MGYSTLIDIVGSVIVGGILMLILLRLNDRAIASNYMFSGELRSQQSLTEVVKILEHDLRRIGYCEDPDLIPRTSDMIIQADSISISFLTDFPASIDNPRGDGIQDRLSYRIGSPNDPDAKITPNPYDRFIYRTENDDSPVGVNIGLTRFYIKYYDSGGIELPHPIEFNRISRMEIDLKVEDSYGYDTDNSQLKDNEKFASSFWKQIKLAAKNLSR